MRTWEENKTAINQLWPTVQFTDEERRLWSEDLSPLDQDDLYGAIRNVKRTHDNPWPQLKWVLDEYRELSRMKVSASSSRLRAEEKLNLLIDPDEDARLAKDFCGLADVSPPGEFRSVEKKLLDEYLPKMFSRTAVRVLRYARRRMLGETERFGRVTKSGDIQTIALPEFS